jgi:ABC-type branched-subunit amino acid transport system substrate-binding protein
VEPPPTAHPPLLRFAVLGQLAMGGMGRVDLAQRVEGTERRELVAVKRLHPHLASDPAFVHMFLEEAKLTGALRHPNVVALVGWGSDPEGLFLATEFVFGPSLGAAMRARDKSDEHVAPEVAAFIGARVAHGLAAVHALRGPGGEALGVVHRDVSPGNVLVGFDGAVKVADLGIAKASTAATHTATGVLKGKLAYMSPEQVRGGALDGRSDIYSLGVVLFELVAGARPFGEIQDAPLMHAIVERSAPPLASVAPWADAEIAAIVDRCLSKDPAGRPPAAEELTRQLDAWIDRRGVRDDAGSRVGAFAERHGAGVRKRVDRLMATEPGDTEARVESGTAPLSVRTEWPSTGGDVAKVVANRPGDDASVRVRTRQVHGAEPPTELHDPAAEPTRLDATSGLGAVRAKRRVGLVAGGVGVVLAAAATVAIVSIVHGGAGSRGPGAAVSNCTTNAACSQALGGPALCRAPGGSCVPILSEDCSSVLGDPTDPRAFVFGVLYPLTGDPPEVATKGEPSVRATDLALREITTAAMGLPGADPRAPRRPVAAVVCDSGADVLRAAGHLVDDVGVPAILGTLYSHDSLDVAVHVTVPKGVLLLCPYSTSPALSTLADQGLVWRTVAPSTYEARAMAPFLAEMERRVRRERHLDERDPIRVAMLVSRGYLGLSIAEIATAQLRFNDKSAASNGRDFLRVDYDDPHVQPDAGYASVVDALLAFRPDVVITAGLRELLLDVLPAVEGRWPDDVPRPSYLLNSDIAISAELPPFVAASPRPSGRVFGITGVSRPDRPAYDAYAIRYRAALERGGEEVHPEYVASGYDAVYTLVYAAAVSGSGTPSGADLARGMKRLAPPGARFDVGPGDVDRVFAALAGGGNVELSGAGGALDFDAESGDPVWNVEMRCFARGADGGMAAGAGSLVYEAKTGATSGTLVCPPSPRPSASVPATRPPAAERHGAASAPPARPPLGPSARRCTPHDFDYPRCLNTP